jgi:hypothetical protein
MSIDNPNRRIIIYVDRKGHVFTDASKNSSRVERFALNHHLRQTKFTVNAVLEQVRVLICSATYLAAHRGFKSTHICLRYHPPKLTLKIHTIARSDETIGKDIFKTKPNFLASRKAAKCLISAGRRVMDAQISYTQARMSANAELLMAV